MSARYHRPNLAIRPVHWIGYGFPVGAPSDDEAEAFELYTVDDYTAVDYFDTRAEAEEYLDLVAT